MSVQGLVATVPTSLSHCQEKGEKEHKGVGTEQDLAFMRRSLIENAPGELRALGWKAGLVGAR